MRAHEDDRLTAPCKLVDDCVDLGLAAHVDAAGRLVQQQDVGVEMQQASERDLLLVTAGELVELPETGAPP